MPLNRVFRCCFMLRKIFQNMGFPDALIVSDLIRGKTGQRKPVFWHILRSSTTFFKKALIWRIAFAQTNPNAFSLC